MAHNEDSAVARALIEALGHEKVVFPNNECYTTILKSYFIAQQAALRPALIVRPRDEQDVSMFVKTVTKSRLNGDDAVLFAVKAGGHSTVPGMSNIQNGITIDLSGMSNIAVNEEKKLVSLGPGTLWGDVYERLDAVGLGIVGGHASDIGVSGFVLGGGISLFSPRFGFACDMVKRFRIALSNGQIIDADQNQHTELWRALKGGLNNFGIVVQIDVQCFDQGKVWGGYIINPISAKAHLLGALTALDSNWDPNAAIEQSYTYSPTRGGMTIASILEYTTGEENPAVLKPFTSAQPQYRNTMRIASVTEVSRENQSLQANGARQAFATTTFYLDLDHLNTVLDIFGDTVTHFKEIEGVRWTVTFRRLHETLYKRSFENGGNSTGVGELSRPAIVCVLTYTWTSAADDVSQNAAAKNFITAVEKLSKDRGVFIPWQYINYAAAWQDPISRFDDLTLQRFRKVREDYDPQGIFKVLIPGGFKIPA